MSYNVSKGLGRAGIARHVRETVRCNGCLLLGMAGFRLFYKMFFVVPEVVDFYNVLAKSIIFFSFREIFFEAL